MRYASGPRGVLFILLFSGVFFIDILCQSDILVVYNKEKDKT